MRVLRVPCTTPETAAAAAEHLSKACMIDVEGTDGRYVLVPSGHSPIFVWDLAETVQEGGFGDDAELAGWATSATRAA